MQFDLTTLLYVVLFIGTLLLVEGVFFLVASYRDGPEKRVNRRLMLGAKNSDARAVLRKMRREDQGGFSAIINRIVPMLDRLIAQSGLELSTSRLAFIMIGICAVCFAFTKVVFFWPSYYALALGIVLGCVGPILILFIRRRRRLAKFLEQLPQAIDILRSSLKAGHPVTTACSLVSKEMADPIGSEFGMITDETTYGLTLEEALFNLAHRLPKPDVEFFVVSLTVARSTGGNIAEILGNLAQVLRDRARMHAKVRAISAEGRWSGVIMGLVPFWVVGMLLLFSPDYLGGVKADPIFWPAMIVAGVLLLIGHFIIYKLVRFRV
ncbi:MAG: type II secretion system F family protein [Gammaproteobacteria bacterium]